jgi:hypothetical protein
MVVSRLTLPLFKLALAAGRITHPSAGHIDIITGPLCAAPRVTLGSAKVHVVRVVRDGLMGKKKMRQDVGIWGLYIAIGSVTID